MNVRRPWTLLAAAGALGIMVLKFAGPSLAAALPPCSFHRLTGLHCPGCGGTRCTTRLMAGDLPGAMAMNPMIVLLVLLAAGLVGLAVLRELQGKKPGMPLLPGWFAWSLVTLLIGFGLTRNLPWWPFTLLAPH